MAGKRIAGLFVYLIACSSTAGSRVEENSATRMTSKRAMTIDLITAWDFKTKDPETKVDKVIPAFKQGTVKVRYCSSRKKICSCKGIMIYGIKTSDGSTDFKQKHKMMTAHGPTACDHPIFYGYSTALFSVSSTQCACIHGEFNGLPSTKFVIPIYVSGVEDKPWAEYGHQDIDPTTLRCNLLDVSHARDFEDENGQTREYQFRLETWKPLEVWHFHSGKPRKKPAIVVLAQCKL